MKKLTLLTLIFLTTLALDAQVAINTDGSNPDASAMLEVKSTTEGLIIPRTDTTTVNTAHPGAIATGLLIYQTGDNTFYYYNGSRWEKLTPGNDLVFERNGTVIRQTGHYDTDDFIIGKDSLPQNGQNVTDKIMFFDKSKGAFRTGVLHKSVNWSPDSIGTGSFAIGYNTRAKGNYSTAWGKETNASGGYATAWGYNTKASGSHSTVWGYGTKASGAYSTASGNHTTALSGYETVLGRSNTSYTPNSTNSWNENDRLFTIGNGSLSTPHNALTIMKNGKTGIGTDTPEQLLDVAGKLKLGNDDTEPEAGTIRWNNENNEFEGYTGEKWLSLTKSYSNTWGTNYSALVSENEKLSNFYEIDAHFGSSLSMDEYNIIIGISRKDHGSLSNCGGAIIKECIGSSWSFGNVIFADDAQDDDQFGYAVAIDSDYLVVGAPYDDVGSNTDQGSVYVFHYNGTSWLQTAHLFANGGAADDHFGKSVSIYGDYILVGAPDNDIGSNNDQGSAYIFHRNGTNWNQTDFLTASDGEKTDLFGNSVSVYDYWAVVGAKNDDVGSSNDQGSAYVFYFNGSSWTQFNHLTAADGNPNDHFGTSVAVNSSKIIIGAPYNDISSNYDQGSAYLFHYYIGNWTQQTKITAPDGNEGDRFGLSVSISSMNVIVGACDKGIVYDYHGSAYIFKSYAGSYVAHLTTSNGETFDHLGESVAISNNFAAVGAPLFNDTGEVYVYEER